MVILLSCHAVLEQPGQVLVCSCGTVSKIYYSSQKLMSSSNLGSNSIFEDTFWKTMRKSDLNPKLEKSCT